MINLKYFFIAVFVTSLFSMQSFAQMKEDAANVKKQMEKWNASFDDAFSKGDAKGMTKGYATDAIIFPPNAPAAKGSDAIQKVWQGYIDMGKGIVKLDIVKMEVFGNIAVSYHTYKLEIKMKGGNVLKDNGKSLVVHKEQKDGSWLIIYDAWNSNLPLPVSNNQK